VGVAPGMVQTATRGRLHAWLAESELTELGRLSRAGRSDWLAGRVALKLSALRGRWPDDGEGPLLGVSHLGSGEPYLAARPELYCSIAHSAGAGLAAVAPVRVGVDLERADLGSSYPIDAVASRSDIAALRPLDLRPHALGAVAWAVKEAVLKATGQGLSTSLRCVQLRLRANRLVAAVGNHDGAAGSSWTVFVYPSEKWAMVLALEGASEQRPVLRWYQRAGLPSPGGAVVSGTSPQGGAAPLVCAHTARVRLPMELRSGR
jgi:phosphopantetheinyl transferase